MTRLGSVIRVRLLLQSLQQWVMHVLGSETTTVIEIQYLVCVMIS